MTDFYTAAAVPATSAQGSSAVVRAEYSAIEAGFAKIAGYTGNAGKVVMINPGGTAQVATTPTGTGTPVLATSPTLVTPLLGTPTSGVLTNCTGLPVGTGIAGLGANVAAALAIAVGSAGAIVVNGGVLGTPSSGTLSNCTGLPVSTGISGLAAGVATFLATPNSANLLAAMTDETGTGANVFATSPTLVTPLLGTPTSGVLANCTGLPISTGVSGLGTGVATALAVAVGSAGAVVTFNGAGGTPSSMVGTNITGTAAGLSIGGNAATATSASTAATVTSAAQAAITSLGTLTGLAVNGLVDISGGSGGQIQFPATQNPSAGVNVLDDYEEGTWLPSLGGSATYTVQSGNYTKIGNFVSFIGAITVNAIGTGSTTVISGLPFASLAVNFVFNARVVAGSATAIVSSHGLNGGGVSTITIVSRTAANAADAVNAIFQNSTNVMVSGHYYTS